VGWQAAPTTIATAAPAIDTVVLLARNSASLVATVGARSVHQSIG
jgi:hypothetical protein